MCFICVCVCVCVCVFMCVCVCVCETQSPHKQKLCPTTENIVPALPYL